MIRKNGLLPEQKTMSSVAYVDQASRWADSLTLTECRGPGDYDNALRRVGEHTGIGYRTLWGLRYRRPKRIFVDIYFALSEAHEAMRSRQLKALEHEIELTKAARGDTSHHARKAEALARAAREI